MSDQTDRANPENKNHGPGRRCTAQTKSGAQCKTDALPGRAFCFVHDPQLAERRAEWSKAGGRGRSNAARARKLAAVDGPADMAELLGVLLLAVAELRAGTVTPPVASALASLARASVQVAGATDFETRLAALEARLGVSA